LILLVLLPDRDSEVVRRAVEIVLSNLAVKPSYRSDRLEVDPATVAFDVADPPYVAESSARAVDVDVRSNGAT
jgi:hypothetical protein